MKTYIKNLFPRSALIGGLNLIPAGRVTAETYTILHRFNESEGRTPWANLVVSGNTLYGTTSQGGGSDNGTLFAVNTDGRDFTNLHDFSVRSTNSSGAYTNSDGADLKV